MESKSNVKIRRLLVIGLLASLVTVLLNSLPMLLPASAFVNALGMANMGLGSVLCFGGILALMKKAE